MYSKLTVSNFLDKLVDKGQYHFLFKELARELDIKESSLSVSLSRLAARGKVRMIRNGFGIITEHSAGAIHPSYFINAMMAHLESRYYVGLLSAAAFWGASHQAAMVYYIVAEKVIKPINIGQIKIEFITKNNFDEITEIQKVSGVGGYYLVSTPELTAIDLIRFSKKSGHLNNIATVLEDLIEKIDFNKLKSICIKHSTPTTAIQRLGFILDNVLGHTKETNLFLNVLEKKRASRILLSSSKKEDFKNYSQYPFSEKWKIYQNTTVEPD
jgi:predicted transcriptional regulator of viral defense system